MLHSKSSIDCCIFRCVSEYQMMPYNMFKQLTARLLFTAKENKTFKLAVMLHSKSSIDCCIFRCVSEYQMMPYNMFKQLTARLLFTAKENKTFK